MNTQIIQRQIWVLKFALLRYDSETTMNPFFRRVGAESGAQFPQRVRPEPPPEQGLGLPQRPFALNALKQRRQWQRQKQRPPLQCHRVHTPHFFG